MPLSSADIEKRRFGIGASEVAALLGVDPWTSPLLVYARKAGEAHYDDADVGPAAEWGNRLEAVVAEKYTSSRPGVAAFACGTVRHPDSPHVLATVDRLCGPEAQAEELGRHAAASNAGTGAGYAPPWMRPPSWAWLVEIKAPTGRIAKEWGEHGTDDLPERYIIQAQQQMAVTGLARVHFAVLIAGHDYREYTVDRDEALVSLCVETCERFWRDHVEKIVPPPVTAHKADSGYLAKLFPRSKRPVREATPLETDLAVKLRVIRERKREVEGQERLVVAQLKEKIGEARGIIAPWGKIELVDVKDKAATAWKALAMAKGATPEEISANTTMKPQKRRFTPRFEGEDEEDDDGGQE